MSQLIVCPFCCEYVGYYPYTSISYLEDTSTGKERIFKQEYAKCANCGKIFLNPVFEKENEEALKKAKKQMFEKLS